MKNLTSNYIFNMLFNLMGVVFPIFTFTYALRVIGAEGIGIVQFYESIISYVILFAALGVPIYAVREVSKYRNDKAKFHATVMEILILYLSLSVIGYVVFGLIAIFVPEVNAHWLVFIIMSSELFFDVIGVSWYFNATEDFKYVAIRSFIIRCALLALLFLVVKSKDDFILYVIIHSGTVTLYAVANFWRFWQKEIRGNKLEMRLDIKRHIKPAIKIFALSCIAKVYINLDSVMLGFMTENTMVGYYAVGIRLVRTGVCVVTAMGAAILPQLVENYKEGNNARLLEIAQKSIYYSVLIAMPLMAGTFFCAPQIVDIFCGEGYDASIRPLEFLAPIILFISISQLIGNNILFAINKEHITIKVFFVGTIINVALNCIFIPRYQANGAACSTLVGESIIAAIFLVCAKSTLGLRILTLTSLQFLVATGTMLGALWAVSLLELSPVPFILLSLIVAPLVYASSLYVMGNTIFKNKMTELLMKFRKRQGSEEIKG